jgi:predicted HicB family RNase H-like nuclease
MSTRVALQTLQSICEITISYQEVNLDILKYKDYEGTAELDMSRKVCRGKILFINDLVTYEAESPATLQAEFEAAVDDYIETCVELKREPQKPLKGLFNVRISSDLHRAATIKGLEDNVSLNEVVTRALDSYLNVVPEEKNVPRTIFVLSEGSLQNRSLIAGQNAFSNQTITLTTSSTPTHGLPQLASGGRRNVRTNH